ncbi:MAG TPA: hypothetical protein VF814_01525 [Casimicrobiaceae bacterium]
MNSFQRKSLYAALAGVGALGVTGAADAVNVNPNGLGQALIYPYYTVNADGSGNAYNSLLSVVNTTNSAKAVKVRFLEGKNSREVLDFNLFLSKNDVWTAAIVPSSSGGAAVVSFDKSCTIPANSAFAPPGADFVNFAYTGSNDDKGGSGLDRTKEGYVEIIEMATFPTYTCTSIQVTHVGGVPFDCAGVSDGGAASDQAPASGGLFGGMSLINVGAGTDYTEDAVALQRFNTNANYQPAGSVSPQLTDSSPKVSVVFAAEPNPAPPIFFSDLGVYASDWSDQTLYNPADPVSATLMHDAVMNEYVLDAGTNSGTDWVVTFPTKRFYVNTGTGNAPRLFQRNFNDGAGACDDVTLNIYDREERTSSTPTTFSPPPPTLTNSICWEANIITFNNSNVLASQNVSNINTSFEDGWLRLGFARSTSSPVHTLGNITATTHTWGVSGFSTGLTKTYLGLPVVGFAVQSFANGTLVVGGTNVLANYGGNFVHKTTTTIIN